MTRSYTYNIITRAILAIIMMGSAVCAWAEDGEPTTSVAKIGETKYATLKAAIEAATDGQTVTLMANVSETETYSIESKHITIDFGTYTVSARHNEASANVFSITATGGLTLTGTTGGFTDNTVKGIFYNLGKLTVEGGVYSTTVDDYGVIYNEGGTCTVNGGTLTGAYSTIFTKGTNTVNVSNGTLNGAWLGIQANAGTTLNVTGGTITATNQDKKLPGIQLKGTGTSATISAGTISGFNGIVVRENSSLTVSGTATISGKNLAITGNGSEDEGNTIININGGTISNDNDVAIYHPQDGTLTITGGTITGTTALEVRSGNVTISGGTLTSNAAEYSCNPNGNGTTTVGAALAIAQHTTKQDISVTISGGEFTGVKAISESNPQENDPAPKVTMSVTDGTFTGGITVEDVQDGFIEGGTFSEAVPAEYCVVGKAPYVDANGACIIVTPETVPTEAEALSNGSYYKVLENAITAAGNEDTAIEVLKDPAAEVITISTGASITLSVANDVTLSKPITNSGTLSTSGIISGAITNSGTLTISSGTISGDVTITDVDATVKIASGVTSTSVVALDDALKTNNVLKSNTTKNTGYTTYWVEKKVDAKVSLTGNPTSEQTTAANALVSNTAISTVENLATNQSLTITVTSVTLTDSKVTNAEFDVKLIGADGQEVTEAVEPAITFHLPIPSESEENAWANLWHNTTALTGATVPASDNKYVVITATTFGTFSYEIIAAPIAEIGVTKFGTMADAITAAGAADEIKLLADVTEDISVDDSKNITLTIGTHTISGNINNAGTLVISENTGTISGTVANTESLTVEGGTVSGAVTATNGSLTISGGTISSTITTSDAAGLKISGGTITGDLTIGGSGDNTISDGNISGAVTTSAATAISGGEISGDITNTGALTITDGTFTGTIANSAPGTVAISGGTHTQLPVAAFCATGYMPLKNDAEKYTMTNEWAITDATDINVSNFSHLTAANGYSVATATYYRNTGMVSAGNTDTRYGTICLPFDIESEVAGVKLYTATSIDETTLTITEVSYPVSAGTPLIFELTAAASHMTVTSTAGEGISININTPSDPIDGNLLRGTYSSTNITTGLTNIYYLNGDTFHQAVQSLKVPAFRAYMYYEAQSSAKLRAFSIVKEGEESTGISAVEALETVTGVYDLNGRKQNGLQRGINLMRRADGSTIKVIVK